MKTLYQLWCALFAYFEKTKTAKSPPVFLEAHFSGTHRPLTVHLQQCSAAIVVSTAQNEDAK